MFVRDPQLDAIAVERERTHAFHASSRPLSEGYEYLGLAGEQALADFAGSHIDDVIRPSGDGGKDCVLTLDVGEGRVADFRVDVKAARKPHHLLVERGKVDAHIYVLALFHELTGTATLIGWQWATLVRAAPASDVGRRGVISHAIPMCRLRPMSELAARVRLPRHRELLRAAARLAAAPGSLE